MKKGSVLQLAVVFALIAVLMVWFVRASVVVTEKFHATREHYDDSRGSVR